MRISDWSSDVFSSDLPTTAPEGAPFTNAVWYDANNRPIGFEFSCFDRADIPRVICLAYIKVIMAMEVEKIADETLEIEAGKDRKRDVEGRGGEVSYDEGGRGHVKKQNIQNNEN